MKNNGLDKLLLSISLILLFYSCGVNRLSLDDANNTYTGTVYLSNGEIKQGQVTMPRPSSKSVHFKGQDGAELSIDAADVDRIEFGEAGNSQTAKYMPVKGLFGKTKICGLYKSQKGRMFRLTSELKVTGSMPMAPLNW